MTSGVALQISARRPGSALVAILVVACTLLLSGASDEKRLTVYSTVANYSLPVTERNRVDSVGLLEALEPLGTVSAKLSGNHWKLRYNDVECEFTDGKGSARIRNEEFDLSANFLLEHGRGLVPLADLSSLLSRILGGPVTLNLAARRMFVGNVAVHFTAQVAKTSLPNLVINFTSPVNPVIASEPGKLRMVFTHDAVAAPSASTLTFDSKIIPSATFRESNGTAELVVNSTVPLLASFSNDGRTITVAPPLPPIPVAASQPAASLPQVPASPSIAANPPVQRYFVVVDAAHGGDERGAALTGQLLEKDVTLAFARRLRQELEARGLPTLLVRDNDATITLDRRAGLANSAHPAIYLCVHASSEGDGVRLYTALIANTPENRGPFLEWDMAQTSFTAASQAAGASVGAELRNQEVSVRTLIVPLRPLNNITTAAVAVEIAPSSGDVSQLTSSDYQGLIAGAVATGVAKAREQLQAARK